MQPDVTFLQVDLLAGSMRDARLEIDNTVLAEGRYASAGLGIERDEPIAGRDVQDSFLFAIGPIRQAATGQLPRRVDRSRAFELSVYPNQLTSVGLERDNRPASSRRRVEHALYHQRCAF